jgi:hypothetical protein
MTKTLVLLITLVLGTLSGEAFARGAKGNCDGTGEGRGMRGARTERMANLSTEQRALLKEMRTRHQEQPCNGDDACREARRVERDAILKPQ